MYQFLYSKIAKESTLFKQYNLPTPKTKSTMSSLCESYRNWWFKLKSSTTSCSKPVATTSELALVVAKIDVVSTQCKKVGISTLTKLYAIIQHKESHIRPCQYYMTKQERVFLFLNPLKTHSVNGSLMVINNRYLEVITGRAKQLHAMQHKDQRQQSRL